MPAQGVVLTPKELNMTLEERKLAIRIFAGMGINKIRFTGG
eukprot:gene40802-49761_t